MTNSPLWQEAAAFAARAHRHQIRKDGKTPYASHPMRVALTVACVFGVTDEKILAAALLHDTIEDCDVDYDDLHERFGMEVADYVACVSKDMRVIEPVREKAYDEQIARGPWPAKLIKLADVYDNLSDALNEGTKRAMLKRAQRALDLAAGHEELSTASAILKKLAQSVRSDLNGTASKGS